MATLPASEIHAIPSQSISLVVVNIVFGALSFVAVVLRIWSRRLKKAQLAVNDYMVLIALILTWALLADLFVAIYVGGEGQHIDQLGLSQVLVYGKVFLAAEPLWAAANCAVKLSILHLYTVIFRGFRFKPFCYLFMGLSIAYAVIIILEAFLLCTPVERNWNFLADGTCANQQLAYLFAGIINLLIDVGIVMLPVPIIWKLQMPWGKRLVIAIMFGIGLFICVITIIRIRAIQYADLSDITYAGPSLGYWTVLEPTLGIVNCCLPIMQPSMNTTLRSRAFTWAVPSQDRVLIYQNSNHESRGKSTRTNRVINGGNSSSSRQGWQGIDHSQTEDAYPMISASDKRFESGNDSTQEENTIEITRDWKVESEDNV